MVTNVRLQNPTEPSERQPATLTSGLYYLDTKKWDVYRLKIRVCVKMWSRQKKKLQKRVTPDETEKTNYDPEHEQVKQKQTLNKGATKQTKTSQWELAY